jgi:hypothetical protein
VAGVESPVHKPKPYKSLICGAKVPDLPMPVLRHQLSHVERRRRAVDGAEPDAPSAEDQQQQP